jgi:hypothetical protein
MKNIVFAIVFGFSATASAFDMAFPPSTMVSDLAVMADAQVETIASSANIQNYLAKYKLGAITEIQSTGGTYEVSTEKNCSFDVSVRLNASLTWNAYPVKNSLVCE